MLDDRAKLLMKALVERYITDGQPVGSRTLSRASGLELSPATIRNVMSDLEELGLIVSPHTSAGRIPTARGYRLFVDTMLTVSKGHFSNHHLAPDQPQKVISNAANLLSTLSQFVGVVIAPRRTSVFRHIEFLRLSERRLLVITDIGGSLAVVFGVWMLLLVPGYLHQGWLHAKLTLVIGLIGYHAYLIRLKNQFAAGRQPHSARWLRLFNEVPALLLIAIVILVVVKPW